MYPWIIYFHQDCRLIICLDPSYRQEKVDSLHMFTVTLDTSDLQQEEVDSLHMFTVTLDTPDLLLIEVDSLHMFTVTLDTPDP